MRRAVIVSGVVACLAAAGPVGALTPAPPAPSTVDTWTLPGCVLRLANSFVPTRQRGRHLAGRWHADATVTCTSIQLDAEVRTDLMRNRVPVSSSLARDACSVTSVELCDALHATHDTAYHGPTGDWQGRLVLFIRGPTSLAAWTTSHACVLDIPSFETICTFVGHSIRL